MRPRRIVLALALAGQLGGCGVFDDQDGLSHPVARALSAHLDGVAEVGDRANLVDTLLYEPTYVAAPEVAVDPAYCDRVRLAADLTCNEIDQAEGHAGCSAVSGFVWAGDVPRCAVRLSVSIDGAVTPEWWAFDVSGEPFAGRDPHCGNAVIEPGEECDDGNLEPWDGCSETCTRMGFGGCETIIWQEFALDGVAEILPDYWTTAHTQLMTYDSPVAIRQMDEHLCGATRVTADNVCRRVVAETSFASRCDTHVAIVRGSSGSRCVVRFQIDFDEVDAPAGVLTTWLPGVLTFTLQ